MKTTKTRNNEIKWLLTAFLLLTAVSAYRQISLAYLPDDFLRPLIVYIVYLVLLFFWLVSCRLRYMHTQMRRFLTLEIFVMIFWITVRFVQDSYLYQYLYPMRISGYLMSVITLVPLLGFYASMCIGQEEGYRLPRRWYLLAVIPAALILMTITNEYHHFAFVKKPGEPEVNLYFHPYIGMYLIILWCFGMEIARVVHIHRASRKLAAGRISRVLPYLIGVMMLVASVPYLASSLFVTKELYEYTAILYFLEAIAWEACVLLNLVPVNTRYGDAFSHSDISMTLTDRDGLVLMKSSAGKYDPETVDFKKLKEEGRLSLGDGRELCISPVYEDYYIIWERDLSELKAVIEELTTSRRNLETESRILAEEIHIRSERVRIHEQNRIYDDLSRELSEELKEMEALVSRLGEMNPRRGSDIAEDAPVEADMAKLLEEIYERGLTIKEKCSKRLAQFDELPGNQAENRKEVSV